MSPICYTNCVKLVTARHLFVTLFYFADEHVDDKWEDAICCAFGCQYILYVHHQMGFDTEHIRAVAKMRVIFLTWQQFR